MPRKTIEIAPIPPKTIEELNSTESSPPRKVDHKPGLDHPTKEERRQRVMLVYDLFLQGKTEHFIIEYCAKPPKNADDRKQWVAGRGAAYKYIKEARAMLEADHEDDKPRRVNKMRRRLEFTYSMAAQMKDHRSMQAAIKLEAELLGDLVVKHELQGKDGGPIDFEIGQVKQRLLDKAKGAGEKTLAPGSK